MRHCACYTCCVVWHACYVLRVVGCGVARVSCVVPIRDCRVRPCVVYDTAVCIPVDESCVIVVVSTIGIPRLARSEVSTPDLKPYRTLRLTSRPTRNRPTQRARDRLRGAATQPPTPTRTVPDLALHPSPRITRLVGVCCRCSLLKQKSRLAVLRTQERRVRASERREREEVKKVGSGEHEPRRHCRKEGDR